MATLHQVISLTPFAKERPRFSRRTGRSYMSKNYKKRKKDLMIAWGVHDFTSPVKLTIIAYRPIPKSWSKAKKNSMIGQYCTTGPDLDNIVGGVMDSIFPDDDSLVVEITAINYWGKTGALDITVTEL